MPILPSVPSLDEYVLGPTGQQKLPTKVGPNITLPREDVITSGYQLDRTAIGPWPPLMPSEVANDSFTGWVRNALHDFMKLSVPANYGSRTSQADFNWWVAEYSQDSPHGKQWGAIAGYPGAVPTPDRPMWNNLEPILWNLQILTPLNMNPQAFASIQKNPSQFVPPGTAALSINGPALY